MLTSSIVSQCHTTSVLSHLFKMISSPSCSAMLHLADFSSKKSVTTYIQTICQRSLVEGKQVIQETKSTYMHHSQ